MSCGRGEGKTINVYQGYIELQRERVQPLTKRQEQSLNIALRRGYEKGFQNMIRKEMFEEKAKRHARKLPKDYNRLKKPILPNRWTNYKEGWSKDNWGYTSENLTPDAVKAAIDKMIGQLHDPHFVEALKACYLPEVTE